MRWSIVLISLSAAVFSPRTSATCVCLCSVSTGGVAFGAYNPLPGAALDTTGSVTISCNISAGSVSYTTALTTGGSGSYAPRQMSSGASHLNYNLYLDSARTTVWGDGTGGTLTQSGTSPIVVPTYTHTDNVYGRILANQQSTPPGSYSDTITVTVTYN